MFDRYRNLITTELVKMATGNCLRIGLDKPDVKVYIDGYGNAPYPLPEKVNFNHKMTLDKETAQELINVLQDFVNGKQEN